MSAACSLRSFVLRCGAAIVISCLAWAGGRPCFGEAAAGLSPDRLKLLAFEIDDARISVDEIAAPEGLVVTLRGDVSTGKEKREILRRAEKVVADVATIRDRIFVKSPEEAVAQEPEVTDLWVLTYIRSRVSPAAGNATASSTPDNVDALVSALKAVYGPLSVQRAGGGRLLLRGGRRQVLEIKRFLSLIDAPWPQVQMNVWAVQVSGSPEDVASRVQSIGDEAGAVRDELAEVQQALARIVVRDDPEDPKHWTELASLFEKFGLDLSPKRSLSLNESLLLLTLQRGRQQKVKDLRTFVRDHCAEWTHALGPETAGERKRGCADAGFVPFRRLEDLLSGDSGPDFASFQAFGVAAYCFADKTRWPYRPDAPRNLMRAGATVDRILKAVMDAFAADMSDLFFDPLLDHIQREGTGHRKGEGVALVGRTRIVVTSGLEAGLAPEMASFVESGRPRPFGKELLDMAFPAGSGAGASAGGLSGSAGVLAGLSGAQALGLAAILSAEPEPAYSKVAPGIALSVRPTVLPDGGSARVTVDARFGVASTPLDQSRQDVWRSAPPAGIASDNVHTDAAVSAFDLFNISSFSVSISHPQTPFYIPILGRLPVIGPAFQIPRRDRETRFESLVLVNTVILPRSIELQRFYGRETDPPRDSGIDCREEREGAGAP